MQSRPTATDKGSQFTLFSIILHLYIHIVFWKQPVAELSLTGSRECHAQSWSQLYGTRRDMLANKLLPHCLYSYLFGDVCAGHGSRAHRPPSLSIMSVNLTHLETHAWATFIACEPSSSTLLRSRAHHRTQPPLNHPGQEAELAIKRHLGPITQPHHFGCSDCCIGWTPLKQLFELHWCS